MIFNSHSHINDSNNPIELINRAIDLNVNKIAAVGYNIESSYRALKLANQNKHIYAICGIQPEEIEGFDFNYEPLKEMIKENRCIALGEIGLDYHFRVDNKDVQLKIFEDQLKIATTINKPIVIHCRDAYLDTFNLLEKYHNQLNGIIMHCYSGSLEMAKRFMKLGSYISFSGVVTFKNAKEIKEVATNIPLDRILVETDDPYLAPVPFRGKENEPGYVRYVLNEIATLRNMDINELEEIVYQNTLKVFNLNERD